MKHINIPIFIPHLGCPNDCAFCNQRSISGKKSFDISSVRQEIEAALKTAGQCTAEIAFFGGSFTGIDRKLMTDLLEIAEDYVKNGSVQSIRLSTRPDYISDEILEILKRYSVRHIELGIQSMDNSVLKASKRGHTPEHSINACKKIKEYGFVLGGQMMIGLPSSTGESERMTAQMICDMGAEESRIYPIVVLKNTLLSEMAQNGSYPLLSGDELVKRTADVLEIFRQNGVRVLRVGLHSGEDLNTGSDIAGGFYHPAMGELVENELFFRKIKNEIDKLLSNIPDTKSITVYVKKGMLSKAIGHKKSNKIKLLKAYPSLNIIFKEKDEKTDAFFTVIGDKNTNI